MAKTLAPGANIALTKENPGLPGVLVNFEWDIVKGNGPVVEVVPSAILCDTSNKAIRPDSLIFFNQLQSPEGSVQYVEEGLQEQIEIDFASIPAEVQKIRFVVYVNPDRRRPGNFGSVRKAAISVCRPDGFELTRFDIDPALPEVTAMIFGEIYRYKEDWKFRAVGQGYTDGLAGVAKDSGVDI